MCHFGFCLWLFLCFVFCGHQSGLIRLSSVRDSHAKVEQRLQNAQRIDAEL